jgi:hypothetical protein
MANTNMGNRGREEQRTTGSEQAGDIRHRAEEAGSSVVEKAKDVGSTVAEKARDAASAAGQKADTAAASVGHGMRSLADTLRERGPQEGMLGSATSGVARTLESSARYLEEQGMTGMLDDLAGLIRRNPIPALLVGIGLGFLIARTTSRS